MKILEAEGLIELTGSKSILNRILILATHSTTPIMIGNWSYCEDIKTIKRALEKLGFRFEKRSEFMSIIPPKKFNNKQEIYIKDSATAFRFLVTRLAFEPELVTTLTMSPQLSQRPHQVLFDILQELGVKMDFSNDKITIFGKNITGGKIKISGGISSQFISALLLGYKGVKDDLVIEQAEDQVSSSYIDMTIAVRGLYSLYTKREYKWIWANSNTGLVNPGKIWIEPDCSSAAFWWALGAMNKGYVIVNNIYKTSIQPDIKFIDFLEILGADIIEKESGLGVCYNALLGGEFDFKSNPDLVPIMAVLGLFCDAPLRLNNIGHLRYKESNRLDFLAGELRKLGASIEVGEDYLIVYPLSKDPDRVILDTASDHRLVMAFTLLQMIFPWIKISETKSIIKSYPEFFNDLKMIAISTE